MCQWHKLHRFFNILTPICFPLFAAGKQLDGSDVLPPCPLRDRPALGLRERRAWPASRLDCQRALALVRSKPNRSSREVIPKQTKAHAVVTESPKTGRHDAIHSGTDLGLFAQQLSGRVTYGDARMTFVIAFLVCCSGALFIAHALEALQAG